MVGDCRLSFAREEDKIRYGRRPVCQPFQDLEPYWIRQGLCDRGCGVA